MDQAQTHRSPGHSRLARVAPVIAAVAALAAFAACNPGGSVTSSLVLPSLEIPSVAVPSVALPSGLGGSLSVTGSGVTGCIDPATAALLGQLSVQGADVETLLAQNKDAIADGLGKFQPSDPNLVTWRDNLIFALRAGDMVSAEQQIQLLASGQVSIPSC